MSSENVSRPPAAMPNGSVPIPPPEPAHSLGWKIWLVLKTIQARLRFVAILVAIGLVISYWDTLKAYYEKLIRPADGEATAGDDVEYYCPMHPQVVRHNPNEKCPICFMPLSKRRKGEGQDMPLPPGIVSRVQLTPYRLALAGVQTAVLRYEPLFKEIEADGGSIEFDEQKQFHIAARVKGRIDKLYVNYTGQNVHAGDPLALVYSPELVVTMQNLLDAQRNGDRDLQNANRDRLRQWGIDDRQIDLLIAVQNFLDGSRRGDAAVVERARAQLRQSGHGDLASALFNLLDARRQNKAELLERARDQVKRAGLGDDQIDDILDNGKSITHLKIRSTVDGHVIRKFQVEGKYIDEGTPLYDVADLSTVWLEAQVYEQDVGFLREGQQIRAALTAFPAREFPGTIAFIHPHLDQPTRTLKVRVNLKNHHHELRPGMYSTFKLKVPMTQLAVFGQATAEDLSLRTAGNVPAEAWQALMGAPSPAGLQGLLEAAVRRTQLQRNLVLTVPESAVIDLGTRKVVYRQAKVGIFEGVAVQLGPRSGDSYPVVRGLEPGDRVVIAGAFNLDAETRLNPAAGSIYYGGN